MLTPTAAKMLLEMYRRRQVPYPDRILAQKQAVPA